MSKGFTLIELIGIILILATIVLVSFPMLTGVTKKENDNKYNSMVEDLCLAGKSYIYANISDYDLGTPDSSFIININTLIEYGNVSSDIINPKTNNSINSDHLYFKVLTDKTLDCEYIDTHLPKEYQELEYITIKNDATSGYINHIGTLIQFKDSDKIEFEYKSTDNQSYIMFVASTISTTITTNNKPYISISSNWNMQGLSSYLVTPNTITRSEATDGNVKDVSISYETDSNNYIAFGSWADNSWSRTIDWYTFKIYKTGKLLRNFIPCYRKVDNEVGMYDLVEGKFYENQGSGDFIAGSLK
ncbi:MAG: hypothetical protein Q4E75_00095 [bacterium]|nr:hypothetical protein [bacterium]